MKRKESEQEIQSLGRVRGMRGHNLGEQFSPREEQIFRLKWLGMTWEQIGEVLGIRGSTANDSLLRAMWRVGEALYMRSTPDGVEGQKRKLASAAAKLKRTRKLMVEG
jgi:hypothetical protein